MVVLDLKAQKLVDSVKGYWIGCLDPDACSTCHFLILIGNHITFFFHDGHAGRHLAVHKHWDRKVVIGEKRGDTAQVRAYCFQVRDVIAVVHSYFDSAAFGVEPEMMRGLVMRKSHGFIAILLN